MPPVFLFTSFLPKLLPFSIATRTVLHPKGEEKEPEFMRVHSRTKCNVLMKADIDVLAKLGEEGLGFIRSWVSRFGCLTP